MVQNGSGLLSLRAHCKVHHSGEWQKHLVPNGGWRIVGGKSCLVRVVMVFPTGFLKACFGAKAAAELRTRRYLGTSPSQGELVIKSVLEGKTILDHVNRFLGFPSTSQFSKEGSRDSQ